MTWYHGRLQGGARVGGRPPPGKSQAIFHYIESFLLLISLYGRLFYCFSLYGRPFFHGGAFVLLFLYVEGFFWSMGWGPFWAFPPTKISAGAHAGYPILWLLGIDFIPSLEWNNPLWALYHLQFLNWLNDIVNNCNPYSHNVKVYI